MNKKYPITNRNWRTDDGLWPGYPDFETSRRPRGPVNRNGIRQMPLTEQQKKERAERQKQRMFSPLFIRLSYDPRYTTIH